MNAAGAAKRLGGKRLLIFDWDGTIADSSGVHSRGFNEAFAVYGVTVDYASIAGLTTAAAVDRIADEAALRLTDQERSALVLDKQNRARRLIETELEPLEGSIEFIRRAGERFTLSLCTSASRRTVDISLRRLGLTDGFHSIFTAEDVQLGKPAPEIFLKALKRHAVEPEAALVFEDADSGIAAAEAAHLDALRIVAANPQEGETTWPILSDALDMADR
ncbi:MAG: HAD family hydrolase [Sphingomonas sp.]